MAKGIRRGIEEVSRLVKSIIYIDYLCVMIKNISQDQLDKALEITQEKFSSYFKSINNPLLKKVSNYIITNSNIALPNIKTLYLTNQYEKLPEEIKDHFMSQLKSLED